jgi:hypothetical protein
MATNYFIAPFDPEEWSDPDSAPKNEKKKSDLIIMGTEFTNALLLRWPKAHVYPVVYGIIGWSIPTPTGISPLDDFEGYLQHNRQIVSFKPSDPIVVYDYIMWHRSMIPQIYKLFFFKESGWNSLVLKNDTSPQDVDSFIRS